MASFDFVIEYRPGKKHGNTDGMSRCPAPQNCDCPEGANLSELKCGPCKKCLKRAELMMSNIKLEINEVTNKESENSQTSAVVRATRQREPV